MRRVQSEGGFATVLRKGDPDRGTLTLLLAKRGEFRGILEREMGPDFHYAGSSGRRAREKVPTLRVIWSRGGSGSTPIFG